MINQWSGKTEFGHQVPVLRVEGITSKTAQCFNPQKLKCGFVDKDGCLFQQQ